MMIPRLPNDFCSTCPYLLLSFTEPASQDCKHLQALWPFPLQPSPKGYPSPIFPVFPLPHAHMLGTIIHLPSH